MSGTRDRYAARFTVLTAMRWFPVGLMVPVLVLLMQARGLDLAEAGRLIAVYGVVALLLELPTGGLADVVGRRPVLAGAALLSAAGSAGLALSASLPLMVVAVAALGLAGASHGVVALQGARLLPMFDREFVFVGLVVRQGREQVMLTGTCEVKDSVETAAVLAVLDASNRWLGQSDARSPFGPRN